MNGRTSHNHGSEGLICQDGKITDPVQFLEDFNLLFCRNQQAHPKMNMESQGTQNIQNNLEKEKPERNKRIFLI